MTVKALDIPGCYLLQATVYSDERGAFFQAFHKKEMEEATGVSMEFVQDNYSISKKGTLRGLHYQEGEHAQAKLLRVLKGAVMDVIVDLRQESPTYLQHLKLQLQEGDFTALYIPRGIAHGFLALEDDTHFFYKCDNFYHPPAEKGIFYADELLKIDWQFPESDLVISPKDLALPNLKSDGK